MNGPDEAIDNLSWMAVRYALGRMSYAPSMCAQAIKDNLYALSESTKAFIARDITEHRSRGDLGMDFDERTWADLLEAIEPETHNWVKTGVQTPSGFAISACVDCGAMTAREDPK